jgi:secreted PhoX family phosphatase
VTKKNEKVKPTVAMGVMSFSQGLISLNLIFQPTGVFNMSSLIRDDDGVSNSSANDHLHDLIEREIARNPSRRSMLKSGAALGLLGVFGSALTACGGSSAPAAGSIGFKAVATSSGDAIVVPEGYTADVMYRWGDPITATAPAFKGDASETWREQEVQSGDNHDGINFFPFPGTDGNSRGILAMNHEYINPEYFHNVANFNKSEIPDNTKKQIAGHGVSVIEVQRNAAGKWEYVKNSTYNRRITGYTPMTITGPAAGHDLLKTAADATGTEVLGTLNNCGAGQTPWGTYITCEENFNGYFGTDAAGWTPDTLQNRYGLAAAGFGYGWHKGDPRFDLAVNPNEPNRFGWVVEIDPYSPTSKPKKRTALGRFKHENAECVLSKTNKAVVYTGCDERNEYLYKFVSTGTYDSANKASGANLLDAGILYVARFDAGTVVGDNQGTGVWLPLVHGQNGLTAENGFANQAEVLIKARQAADRVGATMMDRPEWVAANRTKPGEVFLACTNNNRRSSAATPSSNNVNGTTTAGSARPALDEANPRAVNNWGHVIRINELGADAAALTFNWDIFVIAGNPALEGAKKGSSNIDASNTFNSPDGIQVDPEGRLWIQTDGSYANTGDFVNQGNNQMLVADITTKKITRFLVGPAGCEVTGVCWTPDGRTMFINIQHPGEVGSHPNAPAAYKSATDKDAWINANPTAFSKWPDGASAGRPRSGTVVIRKNDGGVIGT